MLFDIQQVKAHRHKAHSAEHHRIGPPEPLGQKDYENNAAPIAENFGKLNDHITDGVPLGADFDPIFG